MKKDILIYFTGKILPALINLLIIIIAVRYLGKEEYGKYSLIFYSVMLIHTLTFSWIQQSILRFLSTYNVITSIVVKRFTLLTLISSLASVGFVLLTGFVYFKLPLKEINILLLFIFFYNIFMFQLTIYQTTFQSVRYAIFEVFYNVIMFLFIILFLILLKTHSYIYLFAGMALSLIIIEIPGVIIFIKDLKKISISRSLPDKIFIKKIFNYGFIITIWLFVSYLFNISDRFIIKAYVGYDAVGVYSAVYDIIFKISTFLCMPVLLTYHPKIVALWNTGNFKGANRLIKEGLLIELAISVCFIAGFFIIKDLLFIRILNFKGSITYFLTIPIILGAFSWQMALLLHKPLELKFRQTRMLIGILISLIVNIILNLILIPKYGYVVAGFTTLIGVIIYVVFVFISVKFSKIKLPVT